MQVTVDATSDNSGPFYFAVHQSTNPDGWLTGNACVSYDWPLLTQIEAQLQPVQSGQALSAIYARNQASAAKPILTIVREGDN